MYTFVVDDEVVSRKKMQVILKKYGDCIAFDNGKDAIEKFRESLKSQNYIDFIALDVSMPNMDGPDVLKEIRSIEKNYKIPPNKQVIVIMVTADSNQATVVSSIKAGCNDYLVKPFNKDIVRDKLKKFNLV